jgi:exopolyphosphatase/guanosine-5'-triphosphate,3'-diphosphate pyrophosphatase
LKIYLVRHARAVTRGEWQADDLLRPLVERGEGEARAIAEHLAGLGIARVVAAPELRCQQTVEPLALAARRSVHVDDRLGAGSNVQKALEVLPSFDDGPIVLCSHAELIVGLLRFFELGEAEGRDGRIPCRKGSIWVLQGFGRTPTSATYLEPLPAEKGRKLRFPEADEPAVVRAATLDLGSTSFNLLIADATPDGAAIRPIVQEKVMLRLGALIGAKPEIPEEVCARAVEVGRALCEVARREKVELLLPVATAALRDAKNGAEVARRIGSVIGKPVRVLSGEDEAHAIFRAFQARVPLGRERALGLDLGGGSLELAIGHGRGVDWATTLPLGVVRLHGRSVKNDPMTPREARSIEERVRGLLAPCKAEVAQRKPALAIAAGGTARALARLVVEAGGRGARSAWPFPLAAARLAELRDALVPSTHRQRLRMRGMRRGRADLLPTGALVLATVVDELGLDGLTVCDWGLREGVMLEALAANGKRRPGS